MDCLKTSFQMLYSIINLPNINLGQLQIILAAAGLLSVLATVSCTLFLSAKCKDYIDSFADFYCSSSYAAFCLCSDGWCNMAFYHTAICRNWYAEQLPLSACEFQLSAYRWNEFLDTLCYFDFSRNWSIRVYVLGTSFLLQTSGGIIELRFEIDLRTVAVASVLNFQIV